MRACILCVAALLAGTAIAKAAEPAPDSVRASIAAALQASGRAWSDGRLDAFMAIYEDSPATTFVGHDTVVSGTRAIRDRYAAHYAQRSMGRLRLDILDLRLLDPSHAFVIGRYHQEVPGAQEKTGLTTLLFHHTGQAWRIISDHSD